MALSYVTYTGNGSLANYSYANIDLLDDDFVTHASQLRVYVDGVLKTVNTHYTVTPSTEIVAFTGGNIPAANAVIKIARFTKSDDRYVNYTNSTNVTATLLNTDADQLFYLAQEATDLRDTAIVLNEEEKYDANLKEIIGLAPGTDSTSAVTLGQLTAAALGAQVGNLGTKGYVAYTGDNSDVTFDLPAEANGLQAKDIEVYLNGTKKTPVTDYSYAHPTITFVTAPGSGVKIDLFYNKGIVPAAFAADSITTTMVQNRAITEQKIDATGATTNHVLRVTNSPSGEVDWGTIPSSTISDFDTQVRTSRLDQMAVPTADLNLNSRKITNLATPTLGTDAVTKALVDVRAKQYVIDTYQITGFRAAAGLFGTTDVNISYNQYRLFSRPTAGFFTADWYTATIYIPVITGNTGTSAPNATTLMWCPLRIQRLQGETQGYISNQIYGLTAAGQPASNVYGVIHAWWEDDVPGGVFKTAVKLLQNNQVSLHYNNNAVYPHPSGFTTATNPAGYSPQFTQFGEWVPKGWVLELTGN